MNLMTKVLIIALLNIVNANDVDKFRKGEISLNKESQMIIAGGPIDNTCTLKDKEAKILEISNLKWTWTKNGTILENGQEYQIITDNSSSRLIKNQTSFSDFGIFVCNVTLTDSDDIKQIEYKLTIINQAYVLCIFLGSATVCLIACVLIFLYEKVSLNKKRSLNEKAEDIIPGN